jgi:methenyltetrahydromethanopterin cyclohydrolase
MSLVGLNSADFLVDGERFWLLEINPRPGATLDIFETTDESLFAQHMAACAGKLATASRHPSGAKAAEIVYAEDDIPFASCAGLAGLDHRPASSREHDQGWRARVYGPCVQFGGRRSKGARRETAGDGSLVDTREQFMNTPPAISVNERASKLVAQLIADAAELRIGVSRGELGETLIDSGSQNLGSIAAGLRIAEICTGGLAEVRLAPSMSTPRWPWMILVQSSQPVIACLASQYAGWRLSLKEGESSYFALGSGPARALARREPLFEVLTYADSAASAILVIESDRPPPAKIVAEVARDCRVKPENLTIILTPTQSLAGSTQIVARSLEVALHKTHELHFPLERIVEGIGAAPLCPPHPDFVTAMGRTNDAIIFAGQVQLFVSGPASEARSLACRLSSKASRDYGRPFAEIFKAVKGDFYAIDPMLFSPAKITVTALETGESFQSGDIDLDLLDASFA